MTLNYIITLDYRANEPFTRPGCRERVDIGWGKEGWGCTAVVIVMTSSTFWPLVTEVWTHKWAFHPVRVQLSYTQIDMNLPVSFSPSSFLIPAHPKTPMSCCPTPPLGFSPRSAASHTGLSLIGMRPGPVQLTCGLQQSSGLVFKMGLHCDDKHKKKGEAIQNKRKLCWPRCVVFYLKYVTFNTHR